MTPLNTNSGGSTCPNSFTTPTPSALFGPSPTIFQVAAPGHATTPSNVTTSSQNDNQQIDYGRLKVASMICGAISDSQKRLLGTLAKLQSLKVRSASAAKTSPEPAQYCTSFAAIDMPSQSTTTTTQPAQPSSLFVQASSAN